MLYIHILMSFCCIVKKNDNISILNGMASLFMRKYIIIFFFLNWTILSAVAVHYIAILRFAFVGILPMQ